MAKERSIYFESPGAADTVLSAATIPALPEPSGKSVNLKVLLAPINPSDISVIAGGNPLKPAETQLSSGQTVYVPGNEGLGQVQQVGPDVKGLSKGDWVIFARLQCGTWRSGLTVAEDDVIKVNHVAGDGLSDVQAATLAVNPATAWNMLKNFVDLQPGDWVLQNGANSAVGQAAIQIAAYRGLKTLNFVRARGDLAEMKSFLTGLGATHVLTYDDLDDKSLKQQIAEWTGGKDARLLLDCVGGDATAKMVSLLGNHGQVVTYGAMSKSPLPVSPMDLIYKDIRFSGYWQSRWYTENNAEKRQEMSRELVKLISSGKLKEAPHEIVTVKASDDDATASKFVKELLSKTADGSYGKKVLMRIEQVE